ncbi:MAG: response regulator [Desulfarculaceae bacterium]|jgi:response regulator of citrate/malate metabolism
MSESGLEGLDVVILDDDEQVCQMLKAMVESFYTEGEIHAFTDFLQARTFCFDRDRSLAIFVLDVFLGEHSGFDFLEAVSLHYPMAAQDTVIITGSASEEVVEKCMDSGVNYLLEKPVKRYAFQFALRAIASKYLAMAQILKGQSHLADDLHHLKLVPKVGNTG